MKVEPLLAAKAKLRQSCGQGGVLLPPMLAEASTKEIETRDEIAKIAKISHGSISKVKTIIKEADEETKNKLRNGELTINTVYHKLKRDSVKERYEELTPEIKLHHADFLKDYKLIEKESIDVSVSECKRVRIL